MSKIKNTGITDKRGYRYNYYVAKSKILKGLRIILVYGHVDILWTHEGAITEMMTFDDFWPDGVALI